MNIKRNIKKKLIHVWWMKYKLKFHSNEIFSDFWLSGFLFIRMLTPVVSVFSIACLPGTLLVIFPSFSLFASHSPFSISLFLSLAFWFFISFSLCLTHIYLHQAQYTMAMIRCVDFFLFSVFSARQRSDCDGKLWSEKILVFSP